MTDEHYEELRKIVNQYSSSEAGRRARLTGGSSKGEAIRTKDDLAQDMWKAILEWEMKNKREIDLPLARRICYYVSGGLIRKDKRENEIQSLDDLSVLTDVNGAQTDSASEVIEYENPQEGLLSGDLFDSELAIDNLYSQFPEGSKERIFLDFYGTKTDAKPAKYISDNPNIKRFSEQELANLLGYPGSSSGGYRNFKKRMQDVVRIALGEY